MKSTLFSVFACVALLSACSKEDNISASLSLEREPSFSQAVDLARSIHAQLDFANIIEQEVGDIMMNNSTTIDASNIISTLPPLEGFPFRQEINFPREYRDRHGNSILGNLHVLMDNAGNKLIVFNELIYAGFKLKDNAKGAGFANALAGGGGWVIGDSKGLILVPEVYEKLLEHYPALSGQKLTMNGGSTKMDIESFFARVQTDGEQTPSTEDDVYDMGGDGFVSISGVAEQAFRVNEPIVHANACRWYQSGEYVIETEKPITVTFLPNECSPKFSINYKGRTRTFNAYHTFWN